MSDTPRHSVSVAAAIFDDSGENVLLIKRRDNGRWEPPGGVLELGETIEEGLRREVREETGAEVEVGRLTGVYKNMPQGIIALVFSCRALTRASASTDESAEVAWLPLAEAQDSMVEAYAVRLADALEVRARRRPDVPVRAHDGVHVLPDHQPPDWP
jgi:ADP-ribose pyrophosphatase YjhB (NUDIX family)